MHIHLYHPLFVTLYFLAMVVIFALILLVGCAVTVLAIKGPRYLAGLVLAEAADYADDARHWLFDHQYRTNRLLLMRAYGRGYVALTRYLIWAEVMLIDRHRSWAVAIDYIGLYDADEPQELADWEIDLLRGDS